MPLERHVVFGLDHRCRTRQRCVGIADDSRLWLDVGFAVRMYVNRSSEAGNGAVAGFSHSILICLAALMACSSRSQTTAT